MVGVLFVIGIVFVGAALAGGGLRAGNFEVPVITTRVGAVGLFIVGALAVVLGALLHHWETASPQPTATAGPTRGSVDASSGSSPGPASPTSAPGMTSGTELAHYTVDVPWLYGINFDNHPARPVYVNNTAGPSGADLVVWGSDGYLTSSGQIAQLDAPDSDYQSCVNDTRYVSIQPSQLGTVGCFTGHGVVAGFKVLDMKPGKYTSFQVTVWKGP